MTDDWPWPYDERDDSALEQCPACGTRHAGNAAHNEAVYDTDGNRFEHLTETDPGAGPFFCDDCHPVQITHQRIQENRSLEEYAQ